MEQKKNLMDNYLDYDDFSASTRAGGGGGMKTPRKRGGKSGSASNDTGSGTIYNSKHIRVGETKRINTASKEPRKINSKKKK
jgi:hypothetical protein